MPPRPPEVEHHRSVQDHVYRQTGQWAPTRSVRALPRTYAELRTATGDLMNQRARHENQVGLNQRMAAVYAAILHMYGVDPTRPQNVEAIRGNLGKRAYAPNDQVRRAVAAARQFVARIPETHLNAEGRAGFESILGRIESDKMSAANALGLASITHASTQDALQRMAAEEAARERAITAYDAASRTMPRDREFNPQEAGELYVAAMGLQKRAGDTPLPPAFVPQVERLASRVVGEEAKRDVIENMPGNLRDLNRIMQEMASAHTRMAQAYTLLRYGQRFADLSRWCLRERIGLPDSTISGPMKNAPGGFKDKGVIPALSSGNPRDAEIDGLQKRIAMDGHIEPHERALMLRDLELMKGPIDPRRHWDEIRSMRDRMSGTLKMLPQADPEVKLKDLWRETGLLAAAREAYEKVRPKLATSGDFGVHDAVRVYSIFHGVAPDIVTLGREWGLQRAESPAQATGDAQPDSAAVQPPPQTVELDISTFRDRPYVSVPRNMTQLREQSARLVARARAVEADQRLHASLAALYTTVSARYGIKPDMSTGERQGVIRNVKLRQYVRPPEEATRIAEIRGLVEAVTEERLPAEKREKLLETLDYLDGKERMLAGSVLQGIADSEGSVRERVVGLQAELNLLTRARTAFDEAAARLPAEGDFSAEQIAGLDVNR